jgi:hypothetical protein
MAGDKRRLGLFARLRAKLDARRQRSADRARSHQRAKVEGARKGPPPDAGPLGGGRETELR